MATAQTRTTGIALLGAIGSAFAASICCVGPLLLLALGTGGAWASRIAVLEPYRPLMTVITLVLLSLAFFRVYMRPRSTCASGGCAASAPNRAARFGFWIVAFVIAAMLAGPYFIPRLAASTGPSGGTSPAGPGSDQ